MRFRLFSSVVLSRPPQSIHFSKHKGYRLFFDYWFSTFYLMLQLKSSRTYKTATFRSNRLKRCPLVSEKELKKEVRESYDYRTNFNSGLHLVKWYDNKCVHLASTFSGVNATSSEKRWDSKAKNHKDVLLSDMVSDYNSSMGGVDLADMLIALYRTEITTKKRWYLKLIFTDLTHALQFSGQSKSVERPNKRSLSLKPAVGKKAVVAKPFIDVRYDVVDHFPEFGEKRGRCRYCPDGYSSVYCKKCFMVLYLRKDKNCFLILSLNFFDEYKNVLYIIYFCLLCLFLPLTTNLKLSAMNTQNRTSYMLYHSNITFTTVCF